MTARYAMVIELRTPSELLACEVCSPPPVEHFNLWLDVVYSNTLRRWAKEFFIDRRFDIEIRIKFDTIAQLIQLELPFDESD